MDKSACLSQVLVGAITLMIVAVVGVMFTNTANIPSQAGIHAAATK